MGTDPTPRHHDGDRLTKLEGRVDRHDERLDGHSKRLERTEMLTGQHEVRLAAIIETGKSTTEKVNEVRSDVRSAKHWIITSAVGGAIMLALWMIGTIWFLSLNAGSIQQQQSISTTSQPEWVDTSQMAATLNIDTETLRERARSGVLPADAVTRTSVNGEWRFRSDAVDQIAAAMRGGT